MEKKEAQDIARALNSLTNAVKDLTKQIDKQNQAQRDNTDSLKELRTRLTTVSNAFSGNGSIVS